MSLSKNTAARWGSASDLAELARASLARAEGVSLTEAEHLRLAEDALRLADECAGLIQSCAQAVQSIAHERIAGVVSRCLASVFDNPYEFRLEFDRKRGRAEAMMAFSRDDQLFLPHQVGGGVIDVAAFALRVACLMLSKPPVRRVLLLDEPFRHIHGDANRERCREMLLAVSEEFKIQVIVVTGLEWLECGRVVRL